MSGKSFLLFLTLLASLSFISCAPFDVDLPFNSPSNQEAEQSKPIQVHFTIHGSCNVTQSATLHRAFLELRGVASNVSDYIHLNGNQAPLFLTYFGQGADQSVPTNYYDRIAKGDKSNLNFRCDDPDGKCALNKDWHGHWRGDKAKNETVICDLSFTDRLWLDKMCQANVTNINQYWAIDLLHRSLHMPAIGQDVVEQASSYSEIIALAQASPEQAVRNLHTLQAFAFDVASRSALRPEGCMAQMQL